MYEGIDLNGEGPVGLITYMRTDSTNLSPEAVQSVRGFIRHEFGDNYVPEKPNVYGKRQARTQEAHEAIRPTDPAITRRASVRKKALTQRAIQVVRPHLVPLRRVPDAGRRSGIRRRSSITLETTASEPRSFAGSGRKLVFDGFMKVAGASRATSQILPALETGQQVGLLALEPKQQFTSPPARYTEASLVKTLEAEGIGRPSTYAAIIDTIQDRGYVEQESRKFYPDGAGRTRHRQAGRALPEDHGREVHVIHGG